MKFTNKKMVFLLSLVLLVLLPLQSSFAKEWDFQITNDANKTWKVKFNKEIMPETVQKNSVYVTDGKNIHPTTLMVIDNGKAVEIKPTNAYKVGTKYRVVVTKDVKSLDGKPLKDIINVPFEVIDDKASIKSIYSVTNESITSITVKVSEDVFDVKISGTNMHYKGNNTYQSFFIDQKVGNTVTVYAYDMDGKQLETKKYIIGN